MSPSGSVTATVPVTAPVSVSGSPTVALVVGAVLAGSMATLMVRVVVPPWPSLTVMSKVSVRSSAVALSAAALCRASSEGV